MKYLLTLLFAFFSLISFGAFAAGPDFTTLTSGIDFSTVAVAVMAIALALAGVQVTIKGAKIVLRMLGS